MRGAASDLDLAGMIIIASEIYIKIEGTVEAGSLDTTAHTFSVVYSSGAATGAIGVDYSSASVEGTLAEGTWIEVRQYGYSGIWFFARKVEVQPAGTITED